MNSLVNHEKCMSRIAVAAVGDFGMNLMKRLEFSGIGEPVLFRINWDDCLPGSDLETIDVALDSRLRGFTKGDPLTAAKAMQKVMEEFIAMTTSVSFVLLIAQPGDGVGSGVTTELAAMLKQLIIPFMSILILPDADVSGRKQHMTARATISELCQMKEMPVVFDQTDFPGYCNAFANAVLEKVQLLLDALSPGMIQIDFNRIRSALCGASKSTIATARSKGKQRALEVATSVMADSAIEPLLNRKACVLMHLQSDGGLSLHEVEEIASYIADNWGNSIDLTYGVGESRCDSDELRLGLVVGESLEETEQMFEGMIVTASC